ncbi:MAG: MTH938/NDUFAF3 family protein [Anaerolineales bacterium]|jgi:hypothetical protein
MHPQINASQFGSITVAEIPYTHDIHITLEGQIQKRKKKLSKQVYGTSHTLSLVEAQHVYQEGAQLLIFGSGQFDQCRLSDEAECFFQQKNCEVKILPTPQAIEAWNKAQGQVIGLFHITC